MPKDDIDALAAALAADTPRVPPLIEADLLSTGSTLLNLAFSGSPRGGVPKGTYLSYVGDSGSLKSWLSMSLLAEAARNSKFDDYRFVYDAAENGTLMSVPFFFGKKMAERLEPPAGTRDDPLYSRTVQEFYFNVDAALDRGPCVYVLDSMDALNDDADEEVFDAARHRHETGKGEVPGSMGMAKAKTNSKNINRVVHRLRETGSILVGIRQTRDKVGSHIPGLKTSGGGRALKFYSHLEAWTSVGGVITKTDGDKKREIGTYVKIDVQKNRVCGWEGKIEIPFLKGVGIDDLGSCVDFLVDENHWEKAGGKKEGDDNKGRKIAAPEFKAEGTREKLIALIQDRGDEWELQALVGKVWKEIIARNTPERKPRYQ